LCDFLFDRLGPHDLEDVLNSCGTSTTTGGFGGGAGADGPVGPVVLGVSSPPIINIAAEELEQHNNIIPPATAAILYKLIFFLVKDLKRFSFNGKL
jgi:hypothetical protein